VTDRLKAIEGIRAIIAEDMTTQVREMVGQGWDLYVAVASVPDWWADQLALAGLMSAEVLAKEFFS
jgi:hypothetical protein